MADFFKHAMVMLSGAVLAQAIPIAISPILTRLYTPSQFGVFSSVVALAGILSVIASLRFDLAVVLPKEREDAANLVALALVSAAIFCGSVWLIVFGFYPFFSRLQIFNSLGVWWNAVPILAFFIAFQQLLAFFANREKQYKAIAFGNVALQSMAAVTGIGIGLLLADKSWLNGLVVARLCGFAAAGLLLFLSLRHFWLQYRPFVSWRMMRATTVAYRKFPYFNVPYSLAGVFSREFLVLAFTAASQLQAAGHYGFARLILNAPINFLTAALSQVFYREAATNADTLQFRRFVFRLMLLFSVGLTPIFALAGWWAEPGFSFLFGSEWAQSGVFAAMLMPIALLSVFTSWPERIFEVKHRQHWALIIQLCFDLTSVTCVVLMLRWNYDVVPTIAVYVAIQILYQLIYLLAVFHLVGLNIRQYAGVLAIVISGAFFVTGAHSVLQDIFPEHLVRLIIEGFFVLLLSGGGVLLAHRWRTMHFKGV